MSESILDEAKRIVRGDRREAYGDARKSFERIAAGWSALLGIEVSAMKVAQCMIWLKLCRESNKPGRDNRTDICGYAELLDMLVDTAKSRVEVLEEAGLPVTDVVSGEVREVQYAPGKFIRMEETQG